MEKIEELRYLIKAVDKEGEEQHTKMLAPFGVTPSQNEVLKILDQQDGLATTQIGELLICGSDNPSRVLDRLIQKELIKKEKDTIDSRKNNIYLTVKGRAVLKETKKIEVEFNEVIKEKLGNQMKIDEFITILNRQIEGTKTLAQIQKKKLIE
ncbi:MarR family winged helix-turn-helix transcriptional regulator [Vagococcus entomophilus]|uniref:MarR family transcriptional regulator n=1 Tax=Vagococcus entomophilus TaxID=1160095 RepID=A0A430AFC8_9ENTE|nr:MarR family transcriptional regulator [Vagococcus entomophilus]RSU06450.1 MarR family transcriptional regulator [Vagococcus entomophilus]